MSIWRHWYQKYVSQAGISNCIQQSAVGSNHLSLLEIDDSGTNVIIASVSCRLQPYDELNAGDVTLKDVGDDENV